MMENEMNRRIDTLIIAMAVALLAGCGGGNQHPWDTLKECEDQNTRMSLQAQTLQTQNDQLTQQVTTLSALNGKTRLAALDTLEKVRIGKHTGFYDTDENGTKEMLVVYLEPLDTAQDYIKAIGTVNIELWDLNAPEDKAKRAEWTVEPADLQKNWGGTIFRSYYRIQLPLKITADKQKEYTLKATFTDFLSGKVRTDQTTIRP
jgi:outer membrane murein-binding lipoprotein Lpp